MVSQKVPEPTYRLKRQDVHARIAIGQADYQVLKIYSAAKGDPMSTVLHHIISAAVYCWEERHEDQLVELKVKLYKTLEMLKEYIDRYGKLPPRPQ